MAEPDPSSDPDGDAGESRATPRLANPPDGDADSAGTGVDDVDSAGAGVDDVDSAGAGVDDADSAGRSVADPGALREPEPIEPEPLRAENAVFVLLGALGTVALLGTVLVPGLL
ncbi:DUF7312 domain-containing protein [Halobellus salinus]|nr:hypothetical protein [Halobellus salinus]